jgi:hypothetical protein
VIPYSDVSDWVCVYDIQCRYLHYDQICMCADWSPSLQRVRFGAAWFDVPDMPAPIEPSEDQCWEWAMRRGWLGRHAEAQAVRREASKTRSKVIQAFFDARGYNWLTLVLINDQGEKLVMSRCIGILTPIQLRRGWADIMNEKYPEYRIHASYFETGVRDRPKDWESFDEDGNFKGETARLAEIMNFPVYDEDRQLMVERKTRRVICVR